MSEDPGSTLETASDPTTSSDRGRKTPQLRRYHKKSKTGCLACKQRRIKCDEARPKCTRCSLKDLICEYPDPQPLPESSREASSGDTNEAILQYVESFRTHLLPELAHGLEWSLGDAETSQIWSTTTELSFHFMVPTENAWIGSSLLQKTMQEQIVPLASHTPYLVYSILALSAAHLSFLYPEQEEYQTSAAALYHRSLQKFSLDLQKDIDERHADTIYAACILHRLLALFHARAASPESAPIVFSGHAWIGVLQGTKIIDRLPGMRATLENGIWKDLIHMLDAFQNTTIMPGESLPATCSDDLIQIAALERTCYGDEEQPSEVFLACFEMLRKLATLHPDQDGTIEKFLFLISRLPQAFTELLEAGDEYMVMIFGFWCALISRTEAWWCAISVKAECQRICDHFTAAGPSGFSDQIGFLSRFC